MPYAADCVTVKIMGRLGIVFFVVASPLLAQEPGAAQEQQPAPYVFVSDVDMVDQFRVFEDGKSQEIRLFAAGLEESWVGLPPDVKDDLSGRQVIGLIMDTSGSMEDDMPLVRGAALKFLTNIPKTENLFIMDFDENIRLSSYSSDDQRQIAERIYDMESEGWTALYDAVATFLERVYDLDGRKSLVLFSDGVDSRSTLAVGEVFEMVKLSNVTMHAIHFSGGSRNSSKLFTEGRFLKRLARETGGSYAVGRSLEQIDELYDGILEELYSQYSLGYVSANTKRDGKYRKIKVEVTVDDVKVRHRRGYYGLEPPESNQ